VAAAERATIVAGGMTVTTEAATIAATRPAPRALPTLGPPGRKATAAILVATAVAAAVTVWTAASGSVLISPLAAGFGRSLVVVLYPLIGLYAWRRRPSERFGPILVLLGLTYAFTDPMASGDPVAHSVGRLFNVAWVGLYIFAFLSFPSGRLTSRAERVVVWAYAAVCLAVWPLVVLTAPKVPAGGNFTGCGNKCPANGLRAFDAAERLSDVTVQLATVITVGALLAATLLLAWKLRSPLALERRTIAPVLLSGMVVMVSYTFHFLYPTGGASYELGLAIAITAVVAVPIAYLLGPVLGESWAARALWRALGRFDYTRLSPLQLDELCRTALGDPKAFLAVVGPEPDRLRTLRSEPVTVDAETGSTPITHAGRNYAVVHSARLGNGYRSIVVGVGELTATLVEYGRLYGEVVGSRHRIATREGEERVALERDLHDGAQAYLLALQLKLGRFAGNVAGTELAPTVDELVRDAAATAEGVRRISQGIYPSQLVEQGLGSAIRTLPTIPGLRIEVRDDGFGRLPAAVERSVYYTVVEAIQNAAKHSHGRRVVVTLERGDGCTVTVSDDGAGFDPSAVAPGGGLTGMRDRIESVGGRLTTTSALGDGTTVRCTIPVSTL
jgi:signal transduction histidine kinase